MKRRDATSLLTALAGGAVLSPSLLLSACREVTHSEALRFFNSDEISLLEEVADTILPDTTDSPGAKAAGIGAFMDSYVADCLTEADQSVIRNGLVSLNTASEMQYQRPFLKLSSSERHNFLVQLDIETDQPQSAPDEKPHYFSLLKGLSLLGYFTSEIGATQALRYVPVPGKYEGSIAYRAGDKAWAI